jgi:hypothetical protein
LDADAQDGLAHASLDTSDKLPLQVIANFLPDCVVWN